MAPAGLVLAAHPEVTNGGPWPAILRHVLRGRAPQGRVAFATFYRQEAEAGSDRLPGRYAGWVGLYHVNKDR